MSSVHMRNDDIRYLILTKQTIQSNDPINRKPEMIAKTAKLRKI